MTPPVRDNYAVYYADKLWSLLPAVYRALDTDQFNANGPLREMVDRIGATTAALRRSVDRLWENQSIETCDDWAIPYLADLVDTRLIQGLDTRGQRLDVANTIDYRRRKGTLGLLEQLASDITGWDAKAVEFFRRLARTRHGLDPPVGRVAAPASDPGQLQLAEGVIGELTQTRIGGFANLRNVYGAGKPRTAFDEFFYTPDMRSGEGAFGWHGIPNLGIFVWRLISFGVGPVTPVPIRGCPGWYCFDPTGRDIPLFAAQRTASSFGDAWVTPTEGQLPTPIAQPLLDSDIALGAAGLGLYPVVPPPAASMPPSVMSVLDSDGPDSIVPSTALTLRPARGRFAYFASPQPSLTASYRYGFPSMIGAGPFDRRGQAISVATPPPSIQVSGGGTALQTAGIVPGSGTVCLRDSLTYVGAADFSVTASVTVCSANNQRPLIRLDPFSPWIIEGRTADATLALDGLFISGQDIVLRGSFAAVTLTCCTLDPGSAAPPGVFANPTQSPPAGLFQLACDGRELRPTRVWIEANITTLTADRCVLGPIRTRGQGAIETITISNSTAQALRTSGLGPITADEVKDPQRFLRQLQLALDPVSALLRTLPSNGLSPPLGAPASPPLSAGLLPETDLPPLVAWLDGLLGGPLIFRRLAFAAVPLSLETQRLLAERPPLRPVAAVNRLLLEDAYPLGLADAAFAFGDGTLSLSRCTVLGRIVAHRFNASECILQELTQVDDVQDGCVRFTAWASGSRVPRQFESVSIRQSAPLFTSTDFGQPGYAQMLSNADLQRLPPTAVSTTPENTISAGAADGSEMGAYARDKNPIRAQALVLKLQEYMPANLRPIVINVT